MIILLSPSKRLNMEAVAKHGTPTQPRLLEVSEKLIDELRGYTEEDIKALMGVSDAIAELNVQRYRDFTLPFTPENALPALYAFRGDVYDGLDADRLTAKQVEYAQTHVRMLSGLYGLLRPLDLMQAYRLEMGIKLKVNTAKDLYHFWGETIADLVKEDAKASGDDVIVNLASNEYFKSVKPYLKGMRVVTPVFKERRGDTVKIIALMAKRARGAMTRYLVEQGAASDAVIDQFAVGGYVFDPEVSTADERVFVRG